MNIKDYLNPKLINSVNDLELIAKMIAETVMMGINQSFKVGYGQEFSQYRSYEPGDDLRYLDWKLFARNDRYYVRQSEIESNITVRFVIDCSASMNHEFENLKKLDFVKILVATFAYIAMKQHDQICLHGIKGKQIISTQPNQGYSQFHHFLHQLIQLEANSNIIINRDTLLQEISYTRKEMVIFISDMYSKEAELKDIFSQICQIKSEVFLFHVLAENELDPKIDSSENIEDLETGEVISPDLSSAYIDRIHGFINEIESFTLAQNALYQLFSSYQNIDQIIRQFIKRRDRLR